MHGLINRGLQCFLRDTYGEEMWAEIMRDADLGYTSFEAMLVYDHEVTQRVLDYATDQLEKTEDDLLEDLGTYLVSHENTQALRRLLRFGGVDFLEFLHSLDDLPGRARLAVPDLDLPSLELIEGDDMTFTLKCGTDLPGFGHVMMGVLRAMADDYGALAFLEFDGSEATHDAVRIVLLDEAFSEGRSFELARKVG
ncbi:MAG: heme NO-binding domain-containing protein [Pseudomonadota bacterium]